VLDTIRPEQVLGLDGWWQFVVPLEGDYDKLRTSSFQELVSEGARGIGVEDWAWLLDLDGGEGVKGQLEVGLVSRKEIPARLERAVGRSEGSFRPELAPAEREDLPAVAMFADVGWWFDASGMLADGLIDRINEFWSDRLAASSRILDDLLREGKLVLKDGR
jgi:hypothetical protein